ncbi:hypothetical protein ABZX69_32240 [Streptomyces sp. NPDC004074]|uniref:hypothetical protein n=1 Tax=Streptomyces sp. NPDC004074 TaxID=3154277 RepID=UPI0033A65724
MGHENEHVLLRTRGEQVRAHGRADGEVDGFGQGVPYRRVEISKRFVRPKNGRIRPALLESFDGIGEGLIERCHIQGACAAKGQ